MARLALARSSTTYRNSAPLLSSGRNRWYCLLRDQDVFDGVVQAQLFGDAALGAHYFGVAGRSQFQVELGAAGHAQRHAAVAIDQRGANETGQRMQLFQIEF